MQPFPDDVDGACAGAMWPTTAARLVGGARGEADPGYMNPSLFGHKVGGREFRAAGKRAFAKVRPSGCVTVG